MKKKIKVFDHAEEILKALKKGIYMTTKADGKVNTMVISWGALGIEWAKPMFTAYVREHRYTKQMLDKNPEFTINIPMGKYDKNIFKVAGTQSGKDIDKIKELGLTLVESENLSVPAIKEFPLTLECKVVYVQEQDKNAIIEKNQKFYPQDVDGSYHDANQDYHTVYMGEIVDAYILE